MTITSTHNKATKKTDRLTAPLERPTDTLENTLRPQTIDEYIGQSQLKKNLKIFLSASKKRQEPVEHTLLHGPPGLGKTTLANIIAKEMGGDLKVTAAPAIEKQGDLAAILSNLKAMIFSLSMKFIVLNQTSKKFYIVLWKIMLWIL